MKVLLTGITGFVGSHMADYLLANTDATIFATRRWRSDDSNIKHFYGNERVRFIEADLLDRGSLEKVLRISSPDYVLHFAAQSYPMSSFDTPIYTLTINVIGTTNLLEELRIAKNRGICDPVIVSISSSEVYGNPNPDEVPIKETNPIRAANPYSVSKVGHDLMSQMYYKAYDMKVIVTRMFSHEGSRRGRLFALSNFAYQIVQCEKIWREGNNNCYSQKDFEEFLSNMEEQKFKIKVGNLHSVRTYSHIDDAVRGYWLAATKGTVGAVYNIGGKQTCTVGEALERLFAKSIVPRNCFEVVIDPARIRPTDITLQIPDCSKFEAETGWVPIKGLEEIVVDLLNHWRNHV